MSTPIGQTHDDDDGGGGDDDDDDDDGTEVNVPAYQGKVQSSEVADNLF